MISFLILWYKRLVKLKQDLFVFLLEFFTVKYTGSCVCKNHGYNMV